MSGSFDEECDRLSMAIDPTAFERAEWERTDGRVLAEAADLATAAFGARDDLTLAEAEVNDRRRRLILSSADGDDIAAINVSVSNGAPLVWAEEMAGAAFRVIGNRHHACPARADEGWIRSTLAQILSTIERR